MKFAPVISSSVLACGQLPCLAFFTIASTIAGTEPFIVRFATSIGSSTTQPALQPPHPCLLFAWVLLAARLVARPAALTTDRPLVAGAPFKPSVGLSGVVGFAFRATAGESELATAS